MNNQNNLNVNSLKDKNCLIVGKPNDLMRIISTILIDNGCKINIAIDQKNEKDVFLANSIINESWAMGYNGIVLDIDIESQKNIQMDSDSISEQVPGLEILIFV
ncbi:MAG: hypothetical protein DK305_000258 [Chloroflexi bacterium]|jgi:hypothetical protein|nr:MAG: hypothetical protein DK305_000258 [Chloroflexota bacterium]|tara:strand:- start:1491 stop:1802 length:312 start_codon:yes stop_codon:yes gene_type:complete